MIWKKEENKRLVEAISTLQTTDEIKRFFRDLMTDKEIDEFSKRFKAAEMLTKKIPYIKIEEKTGLSSTTIARVSKWLKAEGSGYKDIIKKLNSKK